MTPQQTSFAKWLENWVAARSKNLAAQLEAYLAQQKENKKLIPIARARFNKMNEMTDADKDKAYLKRQEENLGYYATNLMTLEEQIKKERARLKKAKQLFAAKQDNLELYTKLRRHKKIVSVTVVGDKLQIITKKIINHTVDFGKYEILIGHDIGNYFVRNLSYTIGSNPANFPHPHIHDGKICLGEYRDGIYTYDKQGELYLTIDTIIHFLELSDGKRDAYIDRNNWLAQRQKIKPEKKK